MREKTLQILQKVRNKELTPIRANKQLWDLFSVSGSGYDGLDAIVCPKCGSTDIMMPDVGFHEKDKCLECGNRF